MREELLQLLYSLNKSFDINNKTHCQLLCYCLYCNTMILNSQDFEINSILNGLLCQVYMQLDPKEIDISAPKPQHPIDFFAQKRDVFFPIRTYQLFNRD